VGLIGVVWSVSWYWWFRDTPAQNSRVSEAERNEIRQGSSAPTEAAPEVSWKRLLSSRNVWTILMMYFTYGYTGYIYISWFPSYLVGQRHLSGMTLGFFAALPPALGLLAKPLGGWWSDSLTRCFGLRIGRSTVGICGFGIASIAVLPGIFSSDTTVSVIFLAIADAAAALTHGVCLAVCMDVGLKRAGTFSGLMLALGSLGNVTSAITFGAFLQWTGSWTPPFLIGAAANMIGAILWFWINPNEQIVGDQNIRNA